MNELKQINKNVQKKQMLRLIMTCGSVVIGTIAFAKYMYQAGITDTEKAMDDEYRKAFEKWSIKNF